MYTTADASRKSNFKSGYGVSFQISKKLPSGLQFDIAPTYLKKNSLTSTHSSTTYQSQETNNTYLQIDYSISFELGKRNVRPFIEAGCFSAYWLAGNDKGSIPDIFNVRDSIQNGSIVEYFQIASYNSQHEFDNKRDKRLEFGIKVGSGVKYYINKIYGLYFKILYYQSLTGQQKIYSIHQIGKYNKTIGICFGFFKKI